MARTPDRFQGVRYEEGIIFDNDTVTPSQNGEMRYDSGQFKFYESGVVKTLSGGGGSSIVVGSATIDFGSGGQIAELTVADPTVTISTTIIPSIAGSTVDNNSYVHSVLPARIGVVINPGVGFTLRAMSDWRAAGTFNIVFLRG